MRRSRPDVLCGLDRSGLHDSELFGLLLSWLGVDALIAAVLRWAGGRRPSFIHP